MLICPRVRISRSHKKKSDSKGWRPTPVKVSATNADNSDSWRTGILSFRKTSKVNLASKAFVTTTLNKPIYRVDEATRLATGNKDVEGYTDLIWYMDDHTYTTRFFVTSEYNPPYDVVLGKQGMEQLGY
jgi:hypothetical protein